MIREATEEDVIEMAILWRMMVKELRPRSEMNDKWWVNYQKEMMKTDMYCAFVAFYEDVMIGFISGVAYPDPMAGCLIGSGQDFYMVPEFRNEKIAMSLYSKLVKKGKERGVEFMEMVCFKDQLKMWTSKGYGIYKYHVRRAV